MLALITLTVTSAYAQEATTPSPASAKSAPSNTAIVPSEADQINLSVPFGATGSVILLDEQEPTPPAPAPAPALQINREIFFRLSFLALMVYTDAQDYNGGPDFFIGPEISFYYRIHNRVAGGISLGYIPGPTEEQGKIGVSIAPFVQFRLVSDLYLGATIRYMLNACGERLLFQGGTVEGYAEYIVLDWAFARVSAGGGLHWRNLYDTSKKEYSPAWDGGFTGSLAVGGHF